MSTDFRALFGQQRVGPGDVDVPMAGGDVLTWTVQDRYMDFALDYKFMTHEDVKRYRYAWSELETARLMGALQPTGPVNPNGAPECAPTWLTAFAVALERETEEITLPTSRFATGQRPRPIKRPRIMLVSPLTMRGGFDDFKLNAAEAERFLSMGRTLATCLHRIRRTAEGMSALTVLCGTFSGKELWDAVHDLTQTLREDLEIELNEHLRRR